ncbi:hypothetical protein WAA24_004327 [Stenotrophomonas maltophilia]
MAPIPTLPNVTNRTRDRLRRGDEYARILDRLERQAMVDPDEELRRQASFGNAEAVAALLDVGVPATGTALRFALLARGADGGLTARLIFDAGGRIPVDLLH